MMTLTSAPSAHRKHCVRTGNLGEWAAMMFLHALGYEIWDTNVRMGRDEIDIVAYDPADQAVVFAEVKARKTIAKVFRPEMTAGKRKRHALCRAARRWIDEQEFRGGYRIDLVCVEAGEVTYHFKELEWD